MTPACNRRAGLGGALLAAGLLAACTAAVPPNPPRRPSASSPSPSTSATTTAASSTPPAPPTSPVTSPTVLSSPTAHRRHHHHHTLPPPPPPPTSPPPPSSTAPAPPPPPPPPKSTCRHVSVRVIPGGAIQGAEIAGLQFTNSGKQRCTLVGYPRVVLLKDGHRVGTPSEPGGPLPGRAVQVAPGKTVQSILHDYSTCQAPLSNSARVTVPGESKKVVRPAELRACTLRVSQLGPPH